MEKWEKKFYGNIIWNDRKDWEENLANNAKAKEKSGYNDWLLDQMGLTEKENFLVIGCGDGSILAKAAERCWYCIGIDLTRNSLELTKKLLKKAKVNLMIRRPKKEENIPLHTAFARFATANNLPFKGKMFDRTHLNLGGAVAVNNHFFGTKLMKLCLKEAVRVTKDNGFIYFSFDLSSEDGIRFISQDWKNILTSVNKKLEKTGLKLTMKTAHTRNRDYLTELKKKGICLEDFDSYLLLFIHQKKKL